MDIAQKLNLLKINLKSMNKLIVAFSGGVDSTFLLKIAHEVLKENIIAVTAKSFAFPERELKESIEFTKSLNIKHILINSNELETGEFINNSINRCYYCKKEIYRKIIGIANANNIKDIAEGSNIDDDKDYRPGNKALLKFGILSPLKDIGMTKEEIRVLSKQIGLFTWNKPSFACLASRVPYGIKITKKTLKMIDEAEQFLLDLGFSQVRVRFHNEIARIEVNNTEKFRFLDEVLSNMVYKKFKEIGFLYTSLDLKGYRTGSMNESFM